MKKLFKIENMKKIKFIKYLRIIYSLIFTGIIVIIYIIGEFVQIIGLSIVALSNLIQFDINEFKRSIRAIKRNKL